MKSRIVAGTGFGNWRMARRSKAAVGTTYAMLESSTLGLALPSPKRRPTGSIRRFAQYRVSTAAGPIESEHQAIQALNKG
jgi:hypothetical protein